MLLAAGTGTICFWPYSSASHCRLLPLLFASRDLALLRMTHTVGALMWDEGRRECGPGGRTRLRLTLGGWMYDPTDSTPKRSSQLRLILV